MDDSRLHLRSGRQSSMVMLMSVGASYVDPEPALSGRGCHLTCGTSLRHSQHSGGGRALAIYMPSHIAADALLHRTGCCDCAPWFSSDDRVVHCDPVLSPTHAFTWGDGRAPVSTLIGPPTVSSPAYPRCAGPNVASTAAYMHSLVTRVRVQSHLFIPQCTSD
jgi:hypothetical protein